MGLSVSYTCNFNSDARLGEMIEILTEICHTLDWPFQVVADEFPADESKSAEGDIYGIIFTPINCETFSLCFTADRKITDPVFLAFPDLKETNTFDGNIYITVKTQFAGMKVHKIIIEIFKHLIKSGFLEDFKMIDESRYWETGDEELMRSQFKKYNDIMDNISLALRTIPPAKNESMEDFFERIIKRIEKRNNEK